MAVQRDFRCPHCKSTLYKSEQMMMLSEIHQGGGSYMAFTSTETITCPACGGTIDAGEVIAGKHDRKAGPLATAFAVLVLAAICFALFRSCT